MEETKKILRGIGRLIVSLLFLFVLSNVTALFGWSYASPVWYDAAGVEQVQVSTKLVALPIGLIFVLIYAVTSYYPLKGRWNTWPPISKKREVD